MIVVTGVGRSGTSAVAEVLHERIGVPMGLPEKVTDDPPPGALEHATYEDEEIRSLHSRASRSVDAELSLRSDLLDLLEERRERLGEPFGLKDPRILDHAGAWATLLDGPLVVCTRDVEDVVDSWLRVTAISSREDARARIEERGENLQHLIKWGEPAEVLRMDFSEWREPGEIEARLRDLPQVP